MIIHMAKHVDGFGIMTYMVTVGKFSTGHSAVNSPRWLSKCYIMNPTVVVDVLGEDRGGPA